MRVRRLSLAALECLFSEWMAPLWIGFAKLVCQMLRFPTLRRWCWSPSGRLWGSLCSAYAAPPPYFLATRIGFIVKQLLGRPGCWHTTNVPCPSCLSLAQDYAVSMHTRVFYPAVVVLLSSNSLPMWLLYYIQFIIIFQGLFYYSIILVFTKCHIGNSMRVAICFYLIDLYSIVAYQPLSRLTCHLTAKLSHAQKYCECKRSLWAMAKIGSLPAVISSMRSVGSL